MSAAADILSESRRALALAVENRGRLFALLFRSQRLPAEILPACSCTRHVCAERRRVPALLFVCASGVTVNKTDSVLVEFTFCGRKIDNKEVTINNKNNFKKKMKVWWRKASGEEPGWRMAGGGTLSEREVWEGLSQQAHGSPDLADQQGPAC